MSSEPRGEPAAHEASTQARASEPAATPNARSTASSAAGAPDGTDAKSTTKALETNGDDVKMHDAKDDDAKKTEPFSWLRPHHKFVIVLVGPEEEPFGIQKDFLCDRSVYFRDYFADIPDKLEHMVKFPDSRQAVFGLMQNYLYTGNVGAGPDTEPPAYEDLIDLWKLGHKLVIEGLCDKTILAMKECRRVTGRIPSTPLVTQVWKDTPENCDLRELILLWTAEYMRSSGPRTEFAKSLPQEVLSELVVNMSTYDRLIDEQQQQEEEKQTPKKGTRAGSAQSALKKNVHYLDAPDGEQTLGKTAAKKTRHTANSTNATPATPAPTPEQRASGSRRSSQNQNRASTPKVQKKRPSGNFAGGPPYSTEAKLEFCADLLTRMLSGPGFWTRLVGPFKEPVRPKEDGVPDYFDKVKKPMDLGTIKDKMDNGVYKDEAEFASDVRQIFENCFIYWKKSDGMYQAAEKLQKTFEEKYSAMDKWLAKLNGQEGE